jgi:pSer/pThr/pTyr-binding forkhead associated (FHA) protein
MSVYLLNAASRRTQPMNETLNLVNSMDPKNKTERERHLLLFNTAERRLISLTQDTYKVGRSSANEIVIEGDPISRVHARLMLARDTAEGMSQYLLIDGISDEKPSKNGIFVNGIRCKSQSLQNGDILCFANIIKAAYLRRNLNDGDFEKFQEMIASDFFFSGIFQDSETRIRVNANLSNLEFTTIMLGDSSARSKETVSFER